MKNRKPIAVTGIGWEIPGWEAKPLLAAIEATVEYGEFDPKPILGKKGLRYKDRATLLALCAVHKALQDRGLLDVEPERRVNIGVCVSSNFGNVDTVCLESEIICREHVDKTSPMNLPVASSNVIPASIAIRFGFKGINLMLCNGATSGVDAVHIAANMLRSGRAEKMVVVGVEPLNAITEKLMLECDPENATSDGLSHGELAACLILEPLECNSTTASYGTVGEYGFVPSGQAWAPKFTVPDVWFVPTQRTQRARDLVKNAQGNGFAGVPTIDVSRQTGELYGALGVFQVLVALLYLKDSAKKQALVSNGLAFGDGLSSIELRV